MEDKKILITSALPYVNNIPHIGNIIGCVLPGDVLARYYRNMGRKVLYISGTDDYGTTTEIRAISENMSPVEICDKYFEIHKEIYDYFNINFDYFGRTSTKNPKEDLQWNHTKISQEIFEKLDSNDFLVEKIVKRLYCPEINAYCADRFVRGQCPKCSYEKARGDQCDKCGILLNGIELINPVYELNNDYTLEIKETKHLFLDLPKLEPMLRKWFEQSKKGWTNNAISITENWFKEGLKERCM